MSKRSHNLTHRLEELFSTPAEPEADRPQPAEPEEVIAATPEAAHADHGLFEQAEASFVKTILDQLPAPGKSSPEQVEGMQQPGSSDCACSNGDMLVTMSHDHGQGIS